MTRHSPWRSQGGGCRYLLPCLCGTIDVAVLILDNLHARMLLSHPCVLHRSHTKAVGKVFAGGAICDLWRKGTATGTLGALSMLLDGQWAGLLTLSHTKKEN